MKFSALLLLLTLHHVGAQSPYVPASPTNTTLSVMSYDLMPKLLVQFYPERMYADTINRELGARDISQGALVHFSADIDSDVPPTTAPWIALISCDRNATGHSQELDIFTLARDKGARAALLYSTTSETCHLNPVYAHSVSNGEFDIFSTRSLSSTKHAPLGDPAYAAYDAQRLSDSAGTITSGIESQKPIAAGFGLATLFTNATTSSGAGGSAATASAPTNSPSSVTTNTNSATRSPVISMLPVLYTCLGALFTSRI
ncbi:hypothetical protein PC9H_004636 [Pleurotus ostreatus]|uniref:Uncharacterized protein n=1 Tax=Pleurotus ostreatus TaxID=5322 RepID=A0A8H6ZYC1_PLEOS|nr:uncharacterized protein PC9H_004636 [Pleurotus ostreatus]KAF7432694.1 hypothetical protein PC9H_004636 [Pleurotus ostreatus]